MQLSVIDVSVFPAGAGVILTRQSVAVSGSRFPRRCGGDPFVEQPARIIKAFSPQVRG